MNEHGSTAAVPPRPEAVTGSAGRSDGDGGAAAAGLPAVPGFAIDGELGRGGMGVVFRARDLALGRDVAVKLLQDRYPADSPTAARFLDEARVTAQLQHPGVPAVYQVGAAADGRPFLAMKLIKGDTLDALRGTGAPVDALGVFAAVTQAIGYAHSHGVIHRDLKPANVMVGAFGEVQVMDWGLAKVLDGPAAGPAGDPDATTGLTEVHTARDGETPFTQYGSVLGTPAYMAPEQAAGETDKIDRRADVFGLGAVLCVLLTGKPPFGGETADEVRLNAVRGRTGAAFARLDAAGADPGVVALCKRCLAFDPADRPADGAVVAAEVAALRAAADERARRAERDRHAAEVRAAEQAKRRRAVQRLAAAVAGVLLAGVAGTGLGLWRADEQRQAAQAAERAADDQRRSAEAARAAAARLAEARRVEGYPPRIRQAWQFWQDGDLTRMRNTLDALRPGPGEPDLRGFEWHYLARLGEPAAPPLRHDGPVRALAVAPDGRTAATAGPGRPEVWVWDVPTAAVRHKLDAGGPVHAVAFDPDGGTVAAACHDGKVRLWAAADGRPVRAFDGPGGPLGSLAYSPDGTRLAVGVGYWTIKDGNPAERFLPPKYLKPGPVAVYDPRSGEPVARMAGHTKAALAVAFAPSGKAVVSGGADGRVRVWDADTGEQRLAVDDDAVAVFAVAVSPSGRSLVSSGYNHAVRVRDLKTGALTRALSGATSPVLAVAVSPDGRQVLGGGNDRQVRRWAVAGDEIGRNLGHTEPVTALAFDRGWTTLFAAGWDGVVHRWPAARPQEFEPLARPGARPANTYSVSFSADSTLLAATEFERVTVFDVATRRDVRSFPARGGDVILAFSPVGKLLAAADLRGQLHRWRADTGEVLPVIDAHPSRVWALGFSPDGRAILTGSRASSIPGELAVWDADTGANRFKLAFKEPGVSGVRAAAFERDGAAIAYGLDNRVGRVTADGRPAPGRPGVNYVAVSPVGSAVALGEPPPGRQSGMAGLFLYDTAAGRVIGRLRSHTQAVYQTTFSPDGKTVATASWDGTARLWHAATGEEMLVIRRPNVVLWTVAFAPNNHYLAVGGGYGSEGDLSLWDARPLPAR